jgi:hypothetical protein
VDIIWAYIDIVPRDWKLSKEKYPETWLFCVAADSIVISARPVGLNHGMKPVAIVAPDYDGYSCLPSSRMGIVKDMQTLVDFMYSSHVMNIRKAINDMIVVDPEMVNIWDLQNPGPGKIIRMRRSAWGRGTIDQAIKQLDIRDVTQNHVADADFLMSFMQKVLGSTDPATGHIVNKGPRISASQASQAKTSVLSRLEKTARIIDMQSHQDLAYMMASQMQQLMSEDTYVKAMGEWGQRLQADFGITPQSGRIPVSIFDLLIDYDIVSHTGSVPGSEDPDTWIAVLQMAGGIPPLAATLDWPRLFKHISRQMGAKNIDDFIMQTTPLVMPDEQVQSQVQQGNLVPANGIPS